MPNRSLYRPHAFLTAAVVAVVVPAAARAVAPAVGPAITGAGAPVTTSGSFALTWTDRVGNTHPLVNTQVSLYDSNVSPGVDNLIGTFFTDANGQLNYSTNYTRPGGGNLNVQVEVNALVNNVGQFGADYGQVFSTRLPTTYSVVPATAGNSFIAGPVTNANDAGKAIGFLQGLKVANDYYASVGAAVSYVNGRFAPGLGNGSYMTGWYMNLGYDSSGAWDVALHEYGHGVAAANGLQIYTPLGSPHSFNQDNITAGPALGAAGGTQLAWQEGIATYMGTSALNHRLPSAIPGMPATDADSWYNRFTSTASTTPDAYLTQTSFAIDLESRQGIALKYQTDVSGALVKDANGYPIPVIDGNGNYVHQTYNTLVGRGEGDELSVARILWDLDDNTPGEALRRAGRTDQVSVGGQGVWTLMKATGASNHGRLSDLWHAARLSLGTTPLARSLLGDLFETNSVSAVPGAAAGVADGATTNTGTPTLAWTPQNAGNSTLFMVAVYSQDWSTLLELSPQLNSVNSWQLTDPLNPGTYNWVVISNSAIQSAVSFDDSYWSGGASFIVVPEPTSVLVLVATTVPAFLLRRRTRS